MQFRPNPKVALCLTATLLSSAAQAAVFSYPQALAAAHTAAPGLAARSLKIESARAAAQAAGRLPDPKIGFAVENFPVSGRYAGRPNLDDFSDVRVGFSQEVPSSAKRQAQRDRARSDITAAEAARSLESRDLRLGTALAWINLYYAERRLSALDGLLASLAPLWKSAPASIAAGEVRPAQTLETGKSRADLEDRRDELQAAAGRARAELSRWTGDPEADVTGPPPGFEVDPRLLKSSIARLPNLATADAARLQAVANVGLARAAKRPDWGLDFGYQHRDPRFGDMVSVGVTMSLPLFAANRQDPIIAAELAAAGQADAEREAIRRDLVAQLEAGLADHAMHHAQWRRATEILTPLARQRVDLETASYAAGRADLSDLVQAFGALANAQLTLMDREAAVSADAARLVLTFGDDAP